MKLFELFATLALDTSEFDSGVSQSESKWNTFGEKLSGGLSKIGGAAKSFFSSGTFGNMSSWIRSIADETSAAGDKIDKQSQALGMSRKAYQEWDYILSQSGASIDSLGTSMKTLNSTVLNTLADPKKNKDMVAIFDDLGLSIAELNGLTQESQFEKVVRAFQQLPAGAEKSALAVKLFGRNGQDLLPLLNSNADAIDEMRKNAQELGLIMSDEAVDAAVAYNDALDDMSRTFDAVKYAVGTEFLPVLTGAFKKVASYTGGLLSAYKQEGFSGVFKKIGSDIGSAFSNIEWPSWGDIKGRADSWWKNDIKPNLVNILVASFGVEEADAEKALATVESFWKGFVETAEAVLGVAFHLLEGDTEAAKETVSAWWEKAWPAISESLGIDVENDPTWKSVKKFFDDIKTFVEENKPLIIGFFGALAIALLAVNAPLLLLIGGVALLAANWETLTEWAGKAWSAVTTFFGEQIPGWISEKVQGIASAWNRVANGINSAIKKMREWLGLEGNGSATRVSMPTSSSGGSVFGGGSGSNFMQMEAEYKNTLPSLASKFATGLDYVPYNDFPAYLHEGEAVLTKDEASAWRSEESAQAPIDLSALGDIVEAAIARGMRGFGFYVDSQRLADATTEPISRNIADAAWTGRYAT